MNRLWTFFCGFCMGAADLVPGVSGGTVAFVMGIYDTLIASLTRLKISFLFVLGCGVACAFFLLAPLLSQLLNSPTERTFLFAGFFGLIAGSAWFCAKQVPCWNLRHWIALFFGICCSALFTSWQFTPGEYAVSIPKKTFTNSSVTPSNYDAEKELLLDLNRKTITAMVSRQQISPETLVINRASNERYYAKELSESKLYFSYLDGWLVFCGAMAVCAMLLPGISGSYLLMVLGVYPVLIGALSELVQGLKNGQFDFDNFMILANVGVGIVIGALLFCRAIEWLLKHYHSLTIANLIGLMLGAFRVIWPFWTYQWVVHPLRLHKGVLLEVQSPYFPSFSPTVLLVFFTTVSCFTLVIFIEKFASRLRSFQNSVTTIREVDDAKPFL